MANEVRLIDANALLANRDIHINIGAGDNICIDIADIAKAPTIDPESLRPKGRWIVEYDKYCEKWRHTCNRCTHSYTAVIEHLKPYCSCCGAKMEG